MDLAGLFDLVNRGGVLAILVIITVGGWRGWYVWGWHYRELRRERDQWRQLALHGTRLAEQNTEVAERILGQTALDDPELR